MVLVLVLHLTYNSITKREAQNIVTFRDVRKILITDTEVSQLVSINLTRLATILGLELCSMRESGNMSRSGLK